MKDALVKTEEISEIRTKHANCPYCGGSIALQERSKSKGQLICYTEQGIKKLIHLEYRCKEQHCRAGLFYGYTVKKGCKKVFEKDCLENNLLVISRRTALSVPWLYSTTLKIYHFNATFDKLASEYNDFHNFGTDIIC